MRVVGRDIISWHAGAANFCIALGKSGAIICSVAAVARVAAQLPAVVTAALVALLAGPPRAFSPLHVLHLHVGARRVDIVDNHIDACFRVVAHLFMAAYIVACMGIFFFLRRLVLVAHSFWWPHAICRRRCRVCRRRHAPCGRLQRRLRGARVPLVRRLLLVLIMLLLLPSLLLLLLRALLFFLVLRTLC